MKRDIHSIVVCLAAFTLPFMVACSSREESLPKSRIAFWLSLPSTWGDTAYGTTATPTNGEYNPGSGLRISLTSPKTSAVTFGTDNTFIKTLDAVSIQSFDEKYIRSVYG